MSEAEEMANHAELRRLAHQVLGVADALDEMTNGRTKGIAVCNEASRTILALLDKIEALKSQLSTARNDALEEAARFIDCIASEFRSNKHGVRNSHQYAAGYDYIAAAIREMKEG